MTFSTTEQGTWVPSSGWSWVSLVDAVDGRPYLTLGVEVSDLLSALGQVEVESSDFEGHHIHADSIPVDLEFFFGFA